MLFDCSALNETFNVEGSGVMDIDIDPSEKCGFVPPNDIGGEDCFWNNATDDMIAKRNKAVAAGWARQSNDYKVALEQRRLHTKTQNHQCELDGQVFPSKNAAARYAMKEYGVSRNTALRYISEGRHPKDSKQSGREYRGSYTATKYL